MINQHSSLLSAFEEKNSDLVNQKISSEQHKLYLNGLNNLIEK